MATTAMLPVAVASNDDEHFFDARSRTPSVELDVSELSLSSNNINTNNNNTDNNSDEGRTDSGEPAAPLTPEERALLVERVRALLDFYFGDANFSKDQFLRKHASSDPQGEGWISVPLVCSFKKMKLLTTDASVVLDAMRKSEVVVLNEAQDKLKRKDAMENFIEDVLARTIHMSIPRDMPKAALHELCAPFGEIARVRIVDPDTTPLPADIAQHCVDEENRPRFRQLPGMLSAFVQYGSIKQAGIASRALNAKKDWRHPVHVDLIYMKAKNPSSTSNSLTASREGSPAATAFAQRYRSSSFHTNVSSGHHSPLAFDPATTTATAHVRGGSPSGLALSTPAAQYAPGRPRSSSFNVRRGSPASTDRDRDRDTATSPLTHQSGGSGNGGGVGGESSGPAWTSPSTRRRFLSPASGTGSSPAMLSAGRSGLSQVESPEAWRAREHQIRAQAILRSPSGPSSGRGFVRPSVGVAAGSSGACPW